MFSGKTKIKRALHKRLSRTINRGSMQQLILILIGWLHYKFPLWLVGDSFFAFGSANAAALLTNNPTDGRRLSENGT